MLTLPTTLRSRYRLLDRIGTGGFADVYRGEDLVLERPVAVKVVRDLEHVEARPFAREIAALSRLTHPAIVRLFDGGTDNGVAYLVMELVEGRPLDELLAAEAPLDPLRVRDMGRQVAGALAHAHAVDLVHRDVKPGNILIDETGRVRVTDFGVARIVDETVTTTSGTLGTAAYLAPEQVESARVDASADVYALGLVLLECLTGERAFTGGLTEAAVARLSRDPDVPDDLPEPWPALLGAMTDRDPASRPSAEQVAQRLAAPAGRWAPAAPEADDDASRTQLLRRADAPAGVTGQQVRRGMPWLAAVVVLLMLIAVWLFLRSDEPVDEPAPAEAVEEVDAADPPPPESLEEALDQLEEAVQP